MTEPATNPEPAPAPAADTSITLDHWVARAKTAEIALAARDAQIAEHLAEQATHATNLQGQHPADSEWWRVTAIAYNEAARLVREEWS